MSSNLDTAIVFGLESTYGTVVTTTDGFEGKADTFKRSQEPIDSVGFRLGMETLRSDRRTMINMGAEGSLEIDVLTTGFGFLMQSMFGTCSAPVQTGATTQYVVTATTVGGGVAASPSYTVQVQRVDTGGTVRTFTHHGGVVTGWELSQDVGGLLTSKLDMDFEEVVNNIAADTPAYAAGNVPFDWVMASCTVGGAATNVSKVSLNADLALKTDRRFLKTSGLKLQPIRSGLPSYEGTLDVEFTDLTEYDLFVAGTVTPIVLTWTGSEMEAGYDYEIVITLPACQFSGDTPQASLTDLPSLSMPFKVLDNGTDPAITMLYKTTDTAL